MNKHDATKCEDIIINNVFCKHVECDINIPFTSYKNIYDSLAMILSFYKYAQWELYWVHSAGSVWYYQIAS